jgi:methyl-accepting chemotaxis protein
MVSLRPTTRRLAALSAGIGLLLVATAGTWAYVSANTASAHRTEATQATRTLGEDITANVTALIRQDSDLLRTLSREPSFGEWEALPGTDDKKLADATDEAYVFRAEMRQAFADYSRLFPAAFQTLEFVDAESMRPVAVQTKGTFLPARELPKTIDAGQKTVFSSVNTDLAGQTYLSKPYKDSTGNLVISIAAPLLREGTHSMVVTTFTVSQLGAATVVAGGSLSDITGLIDRRDGSVLVSGTGKYAVTDKVAKAAVKALNKHNAIESFPVGDTTVSALPANGVSANGLDLDWLGVVTQGPLPESGMSAALQPAILALAIVGLILLVIAGVLALRVRRNTGRQAELVRQERDRFAQGMVQLTDALARTSTGDLAARLNVELGDEAMTGLAASFDQTLVALRELVASAQANSSLLNAAATELRASSTQQATSANQQSAVVTETTATIEELAATAIQIAENSEAVALVAEQTLATTIEGRNAVEESVAAIEAINSQVGFIAAACEGLGEKISEIGGILAIIDELSDQTNLLALNAAIEAARAGEHGRGFAVVATEIRRLAERSQESTVRIQSIITEISSRARQTVDASAQGSHAVHAVTDQARAAADSLERIAALVDTTTSAAREISAATGQQRSASEQVVQAMAEVSASARQFAAGAKQSASSAQEIADLAVRTEMSISHFVTEHDDEQADLAAGETSDGADVEDVVGADA